jgi:hypothetical protein
MRSSILDLEVVGGAVTRPPVENRPFEPLAFRGRR